MSGVFEVREYDAAGRRGELTVPRADATVETPALLPVVNPHVQTVPPAQLESEFGAEILITNSYVLHGSDDLREPALEQGLHDLLGFSGAIMTDSGSFQLAEYGEIRQPRKFWRFSVTSAPTSARRWTSRRRRT